MQAAVLEIIQAAIQPLTLSEISSRLGQRARPFLNALQEKGWVECIEAGVSVEAEVGSEKSSEPVETEAGSEKSSVSVETKADSEKSSEPVETEAGCHESIGPGGEEANGRQTYHAEGGDIAVPLRRLKASNFPLNAEQQQAVEAICRQFDQFCPFLLDGVTGSGKTEVYLVAVRELLERGQQALILVPEIGLTPQLIQRFTDALGYSPVCYHSDMRERERLQVWLACQQGETKVVIGTRSALFLPLPNLKLIVVDEEHDLSYKQQDGVRYSARDVAVRRAQMEGIPVVLGSATPSLESLANVQRGRYKRLRLNHRALTEVFPKVRKIDLRGRKLDHGLTSELISAIDVHVKAGQQVMLFLNRRGFAPVLYCPECGWIAMCPRCDSKYTLHHRAQRLRCHQCGVEKPLPVFCPVCASSDLVPLGKGTERVELALKAHFPDQTVVRIDRDSARSLDQFNQLMHLAQSGEAQILLGTQMVAKGHHLPNVTLAAVIDMDSALFSLDFRAFERCAQMITQVFGRSGRAESPGEVLIQTSQPDHPLLNLLLEKGYRKVAEQLLLERQQADLPPFSYQVVIRAEAQSAELAEQFLTIFAKAVASPDWGVMGPVPAVQARRAGFYRSVLLIQGKSRAELARGVARATQTVKGEAVSRKVRWHVDVDPVEVG
jgi:primosomal protein N' (replication factor Y)